MLAAVTALGIAACGGNAPAPQSGAAAGPGSASASSAKSDDILAAPPDVAAIPSDAKVEASGLATKVLAAGKGAEHPSESSKVRVVYTGWTTDGKTFDSSLGDPTELTVSGLIKGFREGLLLMVAGEKRRMWIPQALAYDGAMGQPAGMLVFDVTLVEIE
jgi:peptidylprolyl isomerase